MMPRVTHNMMAERFLTNINDIFSRLQKVHDQLTTGHAIRRPSDDVPGATQALSIRSAIQLNAQYLRTIDLSKTWLDSNEGALTAISDVVQRARELAVQGSTDTLVDDDRAAMALEADQLAQAAIAAANTTLTGAYLFGGHKTTRPSLGVAPDDEPFTLSGSTVSYHGNAGVMNREIGPGLQIPINVTGVSDITEPSGFSHPLLSVLRALVSFRDNLKLGTADVERSLGELDTALTKVVALRSDSGARVNRFDFTAERLKDAQLQLTGLLSSVEDVDTIEAATNFAQEQTVYQAALKAGAQAIQPSLLDFLR